MIVFGDTPTLGLLVGAPIGILVTLLGVGCLFVRRGADSYDRETAAWFAVGGFATALVAFAITSVAMWPWKHEYHFWTPVRGEVEQVSKRLVGNGDKGMSEKFVVVIDGQPYGVNDTRASLLRPGDRVSIACKKSYEWGSAVHGWDCKWGADS